MTPNPVAQSNIAYIGIGSNLSVPMQQIQSARIAISDLEGTSENSFSSLYKSPPMGPQDQPDYINAVMAIHTELSATTLLNKLQGIEAQQGRVRSNKRWTARTLDLDLLIYADQEINLPNLIVPHIGISERAFVLYPLQEIAPALVIPKLGPVQGLTANCPRNGLIKM